MAGRSIAGGPSASQTETLFQGRARTLNENTRSEDQNTANKLKIKGDIISSRSGIIKDGKYMNLGLWDNIKAKISGLTDNKRVLQLESIKIYYLPYVSEYTSEFVEISLEVETPNTRRKKSFPVFACMFRASDIISLELKTSWILSNINREMSQQIELKYRTGTKLANCKLGSLKVYCDGHMDSLKNCLNSGSKMLIGKKDIYTGNFAFDISCVKFYYPSGNFKNYDILHGMKIEPLSQHLKYNGVEISRDVLFDILSSLPLEFRSYVEAVTANYWAFYPSSLDFINYMKSSVSRNVTPAISYLDYKSFAGEGGDKHTSYFGLGS